MTQRREITVCVSSSVSGLVDDLRRAYEALIEIQSHNEVHNDLENYLFEVAKWGMGDRRDRPDPAEFGDVIPRRYEVWWIHMLDVVVVVEATSAGKAKRIAQRMAHSAGFVDAEYVEMRARVLAEVAA